MAIPTTAHDAGKGQEVSGIVTQGHLDALSELNSNA
jgi:hypothetical protein